jgi:hypothetical protein
MSKSQIFNCLMITILISIVSCKSTTTNSKEYTDTLYYAKEIDNLNLPIPKKGERKNYRINEIKGFCLNQKYRPNFLQNIELISNQEEFEKIASKSCDTFGIIPSNFNLKSDSINPYPYIDFSNSRIVAIVINNTIMNMKGPKLIDVSYTLDSCYREFYSIQMYFTIRENRNNSNSTRYKHPQLFLYHIKIDENLKNIHVMNSNGMIGRDLFIR